MGLLCMDLIFPSACELLHRVGAPRRLVKYVHWLPVHHEFMSYLQAQHFRSYLMTLLMMVERTGILPIS